MQCLTSQFHVLSYRKALFVPLVIYNIDLYNKRLITNFPQHFHIQHAPKVIMAAHTLYKIVVVEETFDFIIESKVATIDVDVFAKHNQIQLFIAELW